MNNRNANLDLIKCVACVCVVGLHAVGMNNYTVYYICDCGVPLFFMVNGYLMLSREKVDYAYAFRKIFNLLRIVFLWNVLIALPVLLFRHKVVNPFALSMQSLMQKGYLWHFWFFGALILIYLMLPLLHHFFGGRVFHHRIACLVLMCVCAGITFFSIKRGYPVSMFVPQPLRLWTWLFYFMLGGLFSYLPDWLKRFPLALHGLVLLLATILNNIAEKKIGLLFFGSRLAEHFYDELSFIVWCGLLFTFLLRLRLGERATGLVSRLESMTMGVFIIHPILLTGLGQYLQPHGSLVVLGYWIGLTVVSFGLTLLLSQIPLIKRTLLL